MKRSLGTTMLMAAVCLAVMAYFGLQVWNYFSDPLTTIPAYRYQVEESATVTGWVIRREQVLPEAGAGLLRLTRSEGERVGRGGQVAVVYADQASLDRQNQLDALQTRIDQLEYARSAADNSELVLKLDKQIMQSLLSFRREVAADRLDAAGARAGELRSLVLKRDYSYSGGGDIDAALASLQEQYAALRAQAASSAHAVTAPVSGIYSAVVDGYESVLTPERAAELTPSTIGGLQPAGEVSEVGKLITGDDWYYAASLTAEEAERLTEGQNVTLRFAKGDQRDLSVRVSSISKEEGGRVVAVFTSDLFLPELTLLRRQSADIVTQSFTGIRVPSQAVRTVRTAPDKETGQLVETPATGVYCVAGRLARFKPIRVVYAGDDGYILAVPDAQGAAALRAGDEIIVTAAGLYDGKVVNAAAEEEPLYSQA